MIKSIEIKNIKGIDSKEFNLDIIPNKPSLLVAPNGFGKSSFATAFNSLKRDKIKLDEKDWHKKTESNVPKIKIQFKKNGQIIELIADSNTNQIGNEFDYFVINNQVVAKGVGQNYGGRSIVSASMSIETITLIDTIPENVVLDYSYTSFKEAFGSNGKILPNLSNLMNDFGIFLKLKDELVSLERSNNNTIKRKIDDFQTIVNAQPVSISKPNLIQWIQTNKLEDLRNIQYLSNVANVLMLFELGFQNDKEVECYLAAIQLANLFQADKSKFKKYITRKEYELDKQKFEQLFTDFNTTWIEDFKPKRNGTSLVLEFPKAHLISNGQRDILCFIALLERAKKKLKKENSILIIDEVFDYLDDANLIAAQYYITQFIEEYKKEGKCIYPLIMTHLDPTYFKGYVFGRKQDLKVYYLDKSNASVSENLKKILRERNNSASIVKKDIEKHLLHFHTSQINRRADFKNLNLAETWGEGNKFDEYIYCEAQKYCNNEPDFDPFAVCCAVRKKIEEKIYNLIIDTTHQNTFLNDEDYNGTSKKLEFAESLSIIVNETYYLLGIVYNDALHWKDVGDNISPVMAKLKNSTIRKLIITIIK